MNSLRIKSLKSITERYFLISFFFQKVLHEIVSESVIQYYQNNLDKIPIKPQNKDNDEENKTDYNACDARIGLAFTCDTTLAGYG